jgi:large subunit ribosomal protein L19
MKKQVIEFNQKIRSQKKFPDLQAGDVVKMHLNVKEGDKERIQVFEGLIIAIKGRQSSSPTITVRKVSNGVGVEMIMPLYSKKLNRLEFIKRAKVRRAKLYYVRGLTPKQSRMKYKDVSDFIVPEEEKEKVVVESITEEVEKKKDIKKVDNNKELKQEKISQEKNISKKENTEKNSETK